MLAAKRLGSYQIKDKRQREKSTNGTWDKGYLVVEREQGKQMCPNKGLDCKFPSLAGEEHVRQGQHAPPTHA